MLQRVPFIFTSNLESLLLPQKIIKKKNKNEQRAKRIKKSTVQLENMEEYSKDCESPINVLWSNILLFINQLTCF